MQKCRAAVVSSASSAPPQLSNNDYIFSPHADLCSPPSPLNRRTTHISMLETKQNRVLSSQIMIIIKKTLDVQASELLLVTLLFFSSHDLWLRPSEPIIQCAPSACHPSLSAGPHLLLLTGLICSCSLRPILTMTCTSFTRFRILRGPWYNLNVASKQFDHFRLVLLHKTWIFYFFFLSYLNKENKDRKVKGDKIGSHSLLNISGWREMSQYLKQGLKDVIEIL